MHADFVSDKSKKSIKRKSEVKKKCVCNLCPADNKELSSNKKIYTATDL
jgi:hypothetical protein